MQMTISSLLLDIRCFFLIRGCFPSEKNGLSAAYCGGVQVAETTFLDLHLIYLALAACLWKSDRVLSLSRSLRRSWMSVKTYNNLFLSSRSVSHFMYSFRSVWGISVSFIPESYRRRNCSAHLRSLIKTQAHRCYSPKLVLKDRLFLFMVQCYRFPAFFQLETVHLSFLILPELLMVNTLSLWR